MTPPASSHDAPCPHCRRLREERDEALEALRQLRDATGEGHAAWPALWRLTPSLGALLSCLASGPGVRTWEQLNGALDAANNNPERQLQTIQALAWKLRVKLQALGVEVTQVRGVGLQVSAKDRAQLLAWRAAPDPPTLGQRRSNSGLARTWPPGLKEAAADWRAHGLSWSAVADKLCQVWPPDWPRPCPDTAGARHAVNSQLHRQRLATEGDP